MDINLIIVSGNVDKSPTSNKVNEVLYVNFPLAVNTGTVDTPKMVWYTISASGKNAEMILNQVNLYDKLLITGKPYVDTYMGKEKQIVGIQKIKIEKFEFCSPRITINNIDTDQDLTKEICVATE